ncbi:MAG: hypothetical protein ABJN65_15730 [Parasphingorhabdus sp.]
MQDANLDYFYQKEINNNEEISGTIECLHEGNPFVGTLILTDQRLAFIRKGTPGFEVLVIRSRLIANIDQRIDRGLDFILIVTLKNFSQEFELRGIDMAGKQAFVDQIKDQFELCGKSIPPTNRDRPTTHL